MENYLGIVEIYVSMMKRFKDDHKNGKDTLYSESTGKKIYEGTFKKDEKDEMASTTMRMEKKYTLDPSEMKVCVMGKEPCIIPRERKNTLVCFTEVYQKEKEKDFLKMERLNMKDNFTRETLSEESSIICLEVI